MADPWDNVPVVREREPVRPRASRQNERERAETRYRNTTGDTNPLAQPVILPGEEGYAGGGDYLPDAGVVVRANPWDSVPVVSESQTAADAEAERLLNSNGDNAARENALMQGVLLGGADEVGGRAAQAGQMVRNLGLRLSGQPIEVNSSDLNDAYVDTFRRQQEDFARTNPVQSIGLNVAGGLLTGGASLGTGVLGAAATGATYGGVSGLNSAEGNIVDRLPGAALGATVGGVAGGSLQAAAPYAQRLAGIVGGATKPIRATTGRAADVRTLLDSGVSLTPGQRMGGIVQNAENLAQRAPILGPAIRGARQRGGETLNRAVGLRAMDNVDQGIPSTVPTGSEMVSYVSNQLGKEFERGYSMVPNFQPDENLANGLRAISEAKSDLPPEIGRQFDNIIGSRLQRLAAGDVSGQTVGGVRSELNNLAAGYLKSQDPAQQGLGRMLTGVSDELDAAISRQNPEAGRVLDNARQGWTDYIRLERASTAANGNQFSPGQLSSAVRQSDGTVRRGAVARGEARMQDLSRAAQNVMPDSFGNPGTADAIGLGALGTGLVTEPVTTTAIAGGLGAASVPYLMMGRKVAERLPARATRQEIASAIDGVEGAAEALGLESGAALEEIAQVAEAAAAEGRPIPRVARALLERTRNTLGANDPLVGQLQQLLLPSRAIANEQEGQGQR